MSPPCARRLGVVDRERTVATVLVTAHGGATVASWPLTVDRPPCLRTVDEVARLELAARHLGCAIRLRDVDVDLRDLLGLVGLDVLLDAR